MPPEPAGEGHEELTVLDTPDTPTIETLCALLGIEASQTLKCIMFDVGGTTVAVLVPGDREVNEAKLERLVFPAGRPAVHGRGLRRARVRQGVRRAAGVG